jgi:hypothetical protein
MLNCDTVCRARAFCIGSRDAAAAAAAAGWGALLLRDAQDKDGPSALLHTLLSASDAPHPASSVSCAALMLDILTCTTPLSRHDAALIVQALPSLLPLIAPSPDPIRSAWLHLLVAICASNDHTHCSAAARGGALLLPVDLAQSGTAAQILLSLTTIHALAAGALLPEGVAAAADDGECLLCTTGTLQAMAFVMRSTEDPSYLSLAASVFSLQCRHVTQPPSLPLHHPCAACCSSALVQGRGSNNIARLCSLGAASAGLRALRLHSSASSCAAVSAAAHLLRCIAGCDISI